MGGIATDSQGATTIQGLWAAGECACVSLHGANRLGGNALLECLVYGKMTGGHAADYAKKQPAPTSSPSALQNASRKVDALLKAKGGANVQRLKEEMGEAMAAGGGGFRRGGGMMRAPTSGRRGGRGGR